MGRAFFGCSRAEFLVFRGKIRKNENFMKKKLTKEKIVVYLEVYFVIYTLKWQFTAKIMKVLGSKITYLILEILNG